MLRALRPALRERGVRALSALAEENAALKQQLSALKQQLSAQGAAAANGVHTEMGDAATVALEKSKFVGAQGDYTPELKFWYPDIDNTPPVLPCFRLIDNPGRAVDGAEAALPALEQDMALAIIHTMIRVNEFEKIFNDAQRQGRISFFMTSRGEEACAVGSAAALPRTDRVLPQYREMGVFFWRGFSFQDVADQLCSN